MAAEYLAILLRTTHVRPAQESTFHFRRPKELQSVSAIDRSFQQVADILSLGSRARGLNMYASVLAFGIEKSYCGSVGCGCIAA